MTDELSRNERIKEASDYLRGTLAEGLREEITGAIIEDDAQLVKFHGMPTAGLVRVVALVPAFSAENQSCRALAVRGD